MRFFETNSSEGDNAFVREIPAQNTCLSTITKKDHSQNKNRRLHHPIACLRYEGFLFRPEYKGEDLVTVAKVSHKDSRAAIG
jgi:hypothetical protein